MRRLIPRPARNPSAGADRRARNQSAGADRAQRRRAQRRQRVRRALLRVGLPALLVAGLAGTGAWAWESGLAAQTAARALDRLQTAAAERGLAVREVLVTGRARTEPGRILDALGVRRNDPILALDARAARRRLEDLAWVRRATVERRLPDTIFVRLQERRPLAIWQLDGELSVIDRRGERLAGVDPRDHAERPLVVGPGAPAHADKLIAALQSEPKLAQRVRAAVRVGERRWTIHLHNGVRVQLPAEDPAGAWTRLARIERRQGLLQRDVRVVDLRLPDRMVVRMGDDAEPMAPPPPSDGPGGKST